MPNTTFTRSILTPEFTLCFPDFFEPRAPQPGQPLRYGCTAVFPKTADLSGLRALANEAVPLFWGNAVPRDLRNPFGDGDEKAAEWGDVFKNSIYVRFISYANDRRGNPRKRPSVWNTARQLITDPSLVWPGQRAVAYVCASGYENQSRGVHFFISAIQIVGDGERIGFDPDSLGNVFEQRDPVPGAPAGMFEASPAYAPQQAQGYAPAPAPAPAPTPRPTPQFQNVAAPAPQAPAPGFYTPGSQPIPQQAIPQAAGAAPVSNDPFKF